MIPIRHSHLKAMGRSPAHCKLAMEVDEVRKVTPAMLAGTATHALLFETQKVVAYPGPTRRGKAWDEFQADHDGACILTAAEYDKCNSMADAVRNNRAATELLTGVTESTIRFEMCGRACRATPDVRGKTWVTELKTTGTSDPARFGAHALKFAYHSQLAMQAEAVAQSTGSRPEACYIVAVESSPPYAVTVLRLTDRAVEAGDRLWRSWLERLIVCEQSNHWPAYSDAVVDLDVPDHLELDWSSVLEAAADTEAA